MSAVLEVSGIPDPTGQGWAAAQLVEGIVSMNSRFIEEAPTNEVGHWQRPEVGLASQCAATTRSTPMQRKHTVTIILCLCQLDILNNFIIKLVHCEEKTMAMAGTEPANSTRMSLSDSNTILPCVCYMRILVFCLIIW